jgi:cyclophilin family peptidyl-prolyl cis-trans isomerase
MQQRTTPPPTVIDTARSYSATVHTAAGELTIALYPKAAPVTVNNFVYLSQNHFYDGLTFHRRVENFVLQGGDPRGDGTGGPGYKLPDETNPAPWVRGSVAMASNPMGVSGSQFFILLGDAPHLARGGVYNHFGTVSRGMDVVDRLAQGSRIDRIDIAVS